MYPWRVEARSKVRMTKLNVLRIGKAQLSGYDWLKERLLDHFLLFQYAYQRSDVSIQRRASCDIHQLGVCTVRAE